ncbi:hypothetical protein MMC18_003404 [Xylographa bjoerkii]|nr:hypothetical protein [Xylographa bjoerkii]
MRQLVEARGTEDDWTGITDKAVRKQRQNRLNQRAYRRRRAKPVEPNAGHSSISTATLALPPDTPRILPELAQNVSVPTLQIPQRLYQHNHPPPHPAEGVVRSIPYPLPVSLDPSLDIGLPNSSQSSASGPVTQSTSGSYPLWHAAVPSSRNTIIATTSNHFPLPSDHLLTLVQFNVFRALLTNISLLHLTSTFFPSPSAPPRVAPSPSLIPPALRPTPLQLSTPHPLWIDLFPHPVVRDNLIRAGSAVDSHDMCRDIVGGLYGEVDPSQVLGMEWEASKVTVRGREEGETEQEMTGVLVWADPWDAFSWELTEGFMRKWGWMFRGTTDLIDASNVWRGKRGEDRLVVEL